MRRAARWRCGVCTALLCALPGCVTAELWGHRYRVHDTGSGSWSRFEPKRFTRWEWWRVALRVAATPGALAVDVVALSLATIVQATPR